MAERVNNSNSSNVQHVASSSSSSSAPPDNPALNQAAADFASLLGDSSTPSTSESPTNEPTQQRDDQPRDDRVNERDERQESGDDSGDSGEQSQKKKGETQTKETPSLGEAILQSLTKGEPQVAKAEGPAQTTPTQSLDGIVQQVADKVLVSDVSGGREVRIFLKDSVLPGTEVRITQNAGKMQVQFVTDSSKSQDILAQNQAALQQRLSEKLNTHDVVVSVEMESQGHGDQPHGESRGKQEQSQDEDA